MPILLSVCGVIFNSEHSKVIQIIDVALCCLSRYGWAPIAEENMIYMTQVKLSPKASSSVLAFIVPENIVQPTKERK